MIKLKIKRKDEVVVISGSHKGKRGKILEVSKDAQRVLVEGVNIIKKHQRKSQEAPEGAVIEREASIHYSNVMSIARFDEKKVKKS